MGYKKVTCSQCGGRGNTPCHNCNGSGYTDYDRTQTCSYCAGRGYNSCQRCYGSGQMDGEWESSSSDSSSSYSSPSSSSSSYAVSGTDPYKVCLETHNRMVRAYNAGKWDEIIKIAEAFRNSNLCVYGFRRLNTYDNTTLAPVIEGIARANRDNDYEAAFVSIYWNHEHVFKGIYGDVADPSNNKILVPAAFEAGKKAWEKVNGREMTDTDFAQLKKESKRKFSSLSSASTSESSSSSSSSSPKQQRQTSSSSYTSAPARKKGGVGKIIVVAVILVAIVLGRNFIMNIINGIRNKPTRTEQTAAATTATVTADGLNMRSAPSASGDIVKTLRNGDTLTVTGAVENGWTPVSHEGSSGYVSSQYITIGSGQPAASSQQAATTTQTTTPAATTQTQTQSSSQVNTTSIVLTVVNDTQYDIKELFVAPAGSGAWGSNLLNEIFGGGSKTFQIPSTGNYDIKINYTDGDTFTKSNVSMMSDTSVTFVFGDW